MTLHTLSLGERIRLAARLAALEHVRVEIERLRASPDVGEERAPEPTDELRRVATRRAERPAA